MDPLTPDSKATHGCTTCGERMYLERYNGKGKPPFPQNWWFDVVHDHAADVPHWVAVIYYREPGQRFPQPAKYIREEQKIQRKAELQGRRDINAGKPGSKNRSN